MDLVSNRSDSDPASYQLNKCSPASSSGSAKNRRPDMPVYVPRARRVKPAQIVAAAAAVDAGDCEDNGKRDQGQKATKTENVIDWPMGNSSIDKQEPVNKNRKSAVNNVTSTRKSCCKKSSVTALNVLADAEDGDCNTLESGSSECTVTELADCSSSDALLQRHSSIQLAADTCGTVTLDSIDSSLSPSTELQQCQLDENELSQTDADACSTCVVGDVDHNPLITHTVTAISQYSSVDGYSNNSVAATSHNERLLHSETVHSTELPSQLATLALEWLTCSSIPCAEYTSQSAGCDLPVIYDLRDNALTAAAETGPQNSSQRTVDVSPSSQDIAICAAAAVGSTLALDGNGELETLSSQSSTQVTPTAGDLSCSRFAVALPTSVPPASASLSPSQHYQSLPASSSSSSSSGAADDADDDNWEKLFDETGEILTEKLPQVQTSKNKKLASVSSTTTAAAAVVAGGAEKADITKPYIDYYSFQPRDLDVTSDEYNHLIEIYDFPATFQTLDLIVAFIDFKDKGFEIKWVDDTHAIGVFSSALAASSAVAHFCNPLIKVQSINTASRQTKLKAKRTAEFLQPYKPRPATVASVARNMVAGALGLRTRVTKEQREDERRKLKEARERKRDAVKLKNDAWDGTIPQ